jgi:hypothetical protein
MFRPGMRAYIIPLVAGVALAGSAFLGLVALGLMFLSWRIMPRTIADRALIRSQALAIVAGTAMGAAPDTLVGIGIYIGLAAAMVLVCFGLTIIVKRASQTYVAPDLDDDV